MKVLYIDGWDDYHVLAFENSPYYHDMKSLWDEAWSKPDHKWEEIDVNEGQDYFNATAYEFGEVDPDFIEFITDKLSDYDDTKHHDFFIVED